MGIAKKQPAGCFFSLVTGTGQLRIAFIFYRVQGNTRPDLRRRNVHLLCSLVNQDTGDHPRLPDGVIIMIAAMKYTTDRVSWPLIPKKQRHNFGGGLNKD